MTALAGGTRAAAGGFELDYWSAGASTAIRMLERRLDADTSGRFTSTPPRVLVCMPNREWMAGTLFRRRWTVELDRSQADFIIDSERWPCGQETDAMLIGEVKRLGVSFARLYANNRARPLAPEPLEAGLIR